MFNKYILNISQRTGFTRDLRLETFNMAANYGCYLLCCVAYSLLFCP